MLSSSLCRSKILFLIFAFSPNTMELLIGRTTAFHIILNCPQPKKAPNVKMETLSALFHKLFLFIGSLHNFKIGHTNGWLPCHGTLRDPQSFLDVSTPSTLEQSFCLFNGENSARVRPLFALYCTGFVTGEIVSLSPYHQLHQSLPSFVTVTNGLFIFRRPTSVLC